MRNRIAAINEDFGASTVASEMEKELKTIGARNTKIKENNEKCILMFEIRPNVIDHIHFQENDKNVILSHDADGKGDSDEIDELMKKVIDKKRIDGTSEKTEVKKIVNDIKNGLEKIKKSKVSSIKKNLIAKQLLKLASALLENKN